MAGRSVELREGRCFICKERGHIKRDCPELRGGAGGAGGNAGGDRPRRDDGERRFNHGDGGNRRFHEDRGGNRGYPMRREEGARPRYSRSRSPPRRPIERREWTPSRSPPRRHYD